MFKINMFLLGFGAALGYCRIDNVDFNIYFEKNKRHIFGYKEP